MQLIKIAEYVLLRWSVEDSEIHSRASKLIGEIIDQQPDDLKDV